MLVAQMVKSLPAMQETRIQSLGQEESLEKEMAAHSCILVWRISCTEELGRLHFMGVTGVEHDTSPLYAPQNYSQCAFIKHWFSGNAKTHLL